MLKLIEKFDVLLSNLPLMMADVDLDELTQRIKNVKAFIFAESPIGKRFYYSTVIAFILLVLAFQIYIPIFKPQDNLSWAMYPSQYPVIYIFATFWAFFYWGIIFRSIGWYTVSVGFFFYKFLFKGAKHIQVQPIHADGRGGLSILGEISLGIMRVAGVGLFVIAIWAFLFGVDDLSLIIGFGIYLIFLVLAFFLPLHSVHVVMKEARDRNLKKWAACYAAVSEGIDNEVSGASEEHFFQKLERLNQIERFYSRAEKMAVWPFDLSTVKKFAGMVVVPTLMVVSRVFANDTVDMVLDIVKGFLGG